MFKIYNGREYFFQWDLNQKLIIEDASVTEVHFCNRTDECSLVCEVYEEAGLKMVNVPNILLQNSWDIRVYAYIEDHTQVVEKFKVHARSKPADYVYTETEVKTWDELEQKVNSMVAVGAATKQGGEVFNDYETNQAVSKFSTATGSNNLAGLKGIIVNNADSNMVSITDFQGNLPYTEGDTIYVKDNEGYIAYLGAITNIERIDYGESINIITINTELVGEKAISADLYPVIFCLDKPNVGNTDIGDCSIANGYNTKAYGSHSASFGKDTEALGAASLAAGSNSKAIGDASAAIGNTVTTNAIGAFAIGNGSKANGIGSFAQGEYSIASGRGAAALGYKTEAQGGGAFSVGSGTKAISDASFAVGVGTIAAGWGAAAFGRYNANVGQVFSIGNGTSDTNRKNILTVYNDGRATIQTQGNDYNAIVQKQYVDNAIKTAIEQLKAELNLG